MSYDEKGLRIEDWVGKNEKKNEGTAWEGTQKEPVEPIRPTISEK